MANCALSGDRQMFSWFISLQASLTLPDFTDPAEAAMAWAKEYREKKVLAIENKRLENENIQLVVENQELKHDKNYLDLIMRSKALLTISQIAQDYGMSGKAMNKQERAAEIARLEKAMKEAAKMLEFELAADLRDQIIRLRGEN